MVNLNTNQTVATTTADSNQNNPQTNQNVVDTTKMTQNEVQTKAESVVNQASNSDVNSQSTVAPKSASVIDATNNDANQASTVSQPVTKTSTNDASNNVDDTAKTDATKVSSVDQTAQNYQQHNDQWNQYDNQVDKYQQAAATKTTSNASVVSKQASTTMSAQGSTNDSDQASKVVVPTNVLNKSQRSAVQPRDGEYNISYGSCNELNQVDFTLKNPLSGDLNSQVQFNNGGGIKSVTQNGNTLTITTNNDIDFQKPMTATINGQQYTIRPEDGTAMPVVRSQAFDNKYIYNGDDLGATYSLNSTTFKLWAPTASAVSLNLFDNDTDPKSKLKSWTPMKYDPKTGVWTVTINGDLKDTAYDYNVEFADGAANETYDPYATACVKGGFRSVVLSPEEMGAAVTAGKVTDKNDPTNEIIGEIHVRDFTNDPSSGVDSNIRGTYLGAVQPNTTDSKGNPTGLNYLLKQGINTVQIQPMYQYDDDGDNTNSTYQYDWGYDPENYNVPEGWYSTNRDDPATRIKECKQMVQGFHNAGIRVNMDVVYNHVADHGTNALAKTVPGYYFNYGNDGKLTSTSGCGNDVASWRPMARNYILHSVKYWHDNYGIDGFRFDLMGNLDTTTMNDIRKELPDVVMYGEGWNMGTPVPNGQNADQANEKEMPTIGTFNGWGRTVLRGDDNGKPYGYVTGNQSQQTMSQLGNFIYACQNQSNTPSDAVDGGVNYANPTQVINYGECHDNKTLFDVMKAAHPEESDDVLMRRAELANAITILNEGVPYVQVGQGFGRSKNGDANSFRSGDAENNIHWDIQDNRTWATAYERALIQLRNSDPAFRMTTFDDMNKNMKWVEVGSNNGVIGYELTSPETGKKYIIGYSNNASQQDLTGIPDGDWKVLIKDCNEYLDNPQTISVKDGKAAIPSLSCLVLEQDPPKTDTSSSNNHSNSTTNNSGSSSQPSSGSTDSNKPASGTTSNSGSQPSSGTASSTGSSSSQPSGSSSNNKPAGTGSTSSQPSNSNSQPSTGSTTETKPSTNTGSTDSNKPVSGTTSNNGSQSQPSSGTTVSTGTVTSQPNDSSNNDKPVTNTGSTGSQSSSNSGSTSASDDNQSVSGDKVATSANNGSTSVVNGSSSGLTSSATDNSESATDTTDSSSQGSNDTTTDSNNFGVDNDELTTTTTSDDSNNSSAVNDVKNASSSDATVASNANNGTKQVVRSSNNVMNNHQTVVSQATTDVANRNNGVANKSGLQDNQIQATAKYVGSYEDDLDLPQTGEYSSNLMLVGLAVVFSAMTLLEVKRVK